MITEVKKIFKCEHCRKVYQVEKACEYHERFCSKNPSVLRPCHNCIILEKRSISVFRGGYNPMTGEEIESTVSILYCEKRDCHIHTPKVAAKGNAFETEIENIEMPKECEFFKPYN